MELKHMNKQKNLTQIAEYKKWVIDLKTKVRQIQLKAVVAVNQQLLAFYWELGTEIIQKQKNTTTEFKA